MPYFVSQTFFRPDEISHFDWMLPAEIYNLLTLIRRDSDGQTLFIALREMQFLAVIDKNEVFFVDGNGEYLYSGDEGGRVIKLAMDSFSPSQRDSVTAPVPCRIVCYSPDAESLFKQRIIGLLGPELKRYRSARQSVPRQKAKIIPLSS
ncbi:hypothetical protein [Solemya elarraichensis gill symbiont]|uniref:Uncharacterized protein n=1 Tax=Solemya elarraichensis gill symbiont TaxID=1918949 RepID=A0A1T2KZK3_9GAMM|nr:hypothetical protein [Solemya elarraichensis gill symbiont]OOZ38275.1 hypothetical protein BOW52_08875 [Solemya elarraichensis gill symbiont]